MVTLEPSATVLMWASFLRLRIVRRKSAAPEPNARTTETWPEFSNCPTVPRFLGLLGGRAGPSSFSSVPPPLRLILARSLTRLLLSSSASWSLCRRGVVMVVGDSATVVVLPAAGKWEPFPDGVVWVWGALGVRVLTRCAVLNAARCAGGPLLCPSVTFSPTRSLVVVGGRGLCGRGVVFDVSLWHLFIFGSCW